LKQEKKLPVEKLKILSTHIEKSSNVCFIIGAGASRSANIPDSRELIKIIHSDHSHYVSNLDAKYHNDYGKIMSCLAPSERETLIKDILSNAKINWGHIALAQMMSCGYIGKVLTFNFDLILEKASSLLGLHFPVYDFAMSPTNEINRLSSRSIIHLHGQNYGLILLNKEQETQEHKKAIEPIIKEAVNDHITIIIGYGGGADGGLEIINKEYNCRNRLFWLGYEESSPSHLSTLLEKDYTEYIGGCDFDRTMIHLCKELQIWPPKLVDNPITHLISELQAVANYPVDISDNSDLDVLSATRESLTLIENKWNIQEENIDKEIFKSLTNVSALTSNEIERYLHAYSAQSLSE